MRKIAGRDIEIEDDPDSRFARHFHTCQDRWQRKLRGLGMKMLGCLDLLREAAAHLRGGEFPINIREHVNATVAVRVDGNPREGRLFAIDDFNPGEVESIFGKSRGDQLPAFVIADQPALAPSRATCVRLLPVTPPA